MSHNTDSLEPRHAQTEDEVVVVGTSCSAADMVTSHFPTLRSNIEKV